MKKGKIVEKKNQQENIPVDPNEGLTPEEARMIQESMGNPLNTGMGNMPPVQPQTMPPTQLPTPPWEMNRKMQESASSNPIDSPKPFPTVPINMNVIPDVDITPVSFGAEYDHLPIVDVASVLPSGGFSYPQNYDIKYRPYVFGEINKISEDKMPFKDIVKIALSGIYTSFPAKDLTFYDFTFLALLRKLSSLKDSKVKVTHKCSNCKKLNTYVINVSSDENTDLNFWEIKYTDLPITVQLGFGEETLSEYTFMPLTINNYLFLANNGLEKNMSATLAAQCTSHGFDEMFRKINVVTGEDETLLREVDDLLTHGLKPIASKCDSCGVITMLRIDSNKVILRPFRRSSEVVKDRIRFG